ncbi:hypothetical protein ABTX71_12775 [Streptomyces parvulus]|uniref:hypothetical protein n=1 Tax=Streptomyces parvulus TaxID=146923 RepID=UPI00332B1ABD
MSAFDDIRRALTDAYGTNVIFDDLTAEDLIKALIAEQRLDAENYPGELAMYRGLVRVLRTVVRENDTLDEVRRLLWQHAGDERDAAAGCVRPEGADSPINAIVAGELRAAAHDIGDRAKAGGSRARGLVFARKLLLARADGTSPEPPRQNVDHVAAAARLREQPGRWLAIGTYGNPQSATSLVRQLRSGGGRITAYRPVDDFEFRIEATADGACIWGRALTVQLEAGGRDA